MQDAARRAVREDIAREGHRDRVASAAALLRSMSKNHALVDGDTRLGWLATAVFLEINRVGVGHEEIDEMAGQLRSLVGSGRTMLR